MHDGVLMAKFVQSATRGLNQDVDMSPVTLQNGSHTLFTCGDAESPFVAPDQRNLDLQDFLATRPAPISAKSKKLSDADYCTLRFHPFFCEQRRGFT